MSDTEKAEKAAPKRTGPKGRSPSYPGIDVGTAIQRAEKLYEKERDHSAHFDTILRHWGYAPKTGPGKITFAALKKYGLLVEEGSGATRRGRLSDLALGIIQDQRLNSGARIQSIKRAALMPAIHRELWDQYRGALPSDENLRFTLLRERNFTETGATEFIQQFRATIAFAKLGQSDNMPPESAEEQETNQGGAMDGGSGTALLTPPADPKARSVQLPLGGGRWATLQAPFPFSEEDWTLMLGVLQAMKPGLVSQTRMHLGSFAGVEPLAEGEDYPEEPEE
jgi:hypothetical protein